MKHSSGEDTNVGNLTVRKHKQLRSDLVESAWTANLTFFEYFFDKKNYIRMTKNKSVL